MSVSNLCVSKLCVRELCEEVVCEGVVRRAAGDGRRKTDADGSTQPKTRGSHPSMSNFCVKAD